MRACVRVHTHTHTHTLLSLSLSAAKKTNGWGDTTTKNKRLLNTEKGGRKEERQNGVCVCAVLRAVFCLPLRVAYVRLAFDARGDRTHTAPRGGFSATSLAVPFGGD